MYSYGISMNKRSKHIIAYVKSYELCFFLCFCFKRIGQWSFLDEIMTYRSTGRQNKMFFADFSLKLVET